MPRNMGVEEITMATIENKDLKDDETLSEVQADEVKGGVGLLLPAVQQVREAARSKPQSASVNTMTTNLKQ